MRLSALVVSFPCIFDTMRPEEIHDKRVLLSPLNWGMGHVSRCIGLIHQLLEQNNVITVASNAEQEVIFRMYFPELDYVALEGYPFQFKGNGNFAWDLAQNLGALKSRLKKELKETQTLVRSHTIDVVLSDHRYGFFCEDVPSVFITHQYHLPVKGMQVLADKWHKKRLRPFDHIWVMDYPDSRLSGKLSANPNDNRVKYVGPYSRFSLYDLNREKTEETVVVVSGPEVYAQQFADEIRANHPEATFICPDAIELDEVKRTSGNWKEQDTAILNAQRLISRSGYSTIMDLEALKIPAFLYPTPGQAEQIYLHNRLTDCSEYNP